MCPSKSHYTEGEDPKTTIVSTLGKRSNSSTAESTTTSLTESTHSSSNDWENLAQCEHKKRRQAEEENKILRREIKSQMYFAQTLQQFFIDSKESQFFPNSFTMDNSTLQLMSTNLAVRRAKVGWVVVNNILEYF